MNINRDFWKTTFTLFQIARLIYNSIKDNKEWNILFSTIKWVYEIKIKKTHVVNWKQANIVILDDKII